MLVFLDESGDPGMKLDKGSSELFVVALVVFSDYGEAQRCDDAIHAHRKASGLADNFEFHCGLNSPRQREAFLGVIQEFDFKSHVFALNKRKATGPGFQYKSPLYKWTAKTTFENARAFLDDAKVIIDGCGDRQFRRELTAYLRKHVNDSGTPRPTIREVVIQPSHKNNLLQVADYVASVSARALTGKRDGARLRRTYLQHREGSFRVWPP
jgi:hypothetical protein